MLAIDPTQLPYGDVYKLMIGAIVPRPIAFVSTVDPSGIRNLAPFSYFTACSSNPPMVCFTASVRRGLLPHKDTLSNIEATREFVVNIVSEEIVEQMNQTAAEVPPEIDEFELSGLTPVASDLVKPPRVAESKFHMECRLHQILRFGDQPGAGVLVIGQVLLFHVLDSIIDDGRIDPRKLKAIGRMGGPTYVHTSEIFNMERPK